MHYLIGAVLGFTVVVLASLIGFDRDRAFYPVLLIIIATYYILFAVMGDTGHALLSESLIATGFLLLAVTGFKFNLWFVAAGLAAHGLFDLTHHLFIDNRGVPLWWPGFCLTFDVVAGGFLTLLLLKRDNK